MGQKALEPRRQPRQDRSRHRVDQILDAAAGIITENGFDAVTTNLIAERAAIPIGSIYQFFPNKFAILNALNVRYLEQIEVLHKGPDPGEDPTQTWEEMVDATIDKLAEFWASEKVLPLLWLGVLNTPQLHPAVAESNRRSEEYNLILLDFVLPHVDALRRRLIARVMLHLSERLLTLSVTSGVEMAPHIVGELKVNLKAYIRAYMDTGTPNNSHQARTGAP